MLKMDNIFSLLVYIMRNQTFMATINFPCKHILIEQQINVNQLPTFVHHQIGLSLGK